MAAGVLLLCLHHFTKAKVAKSNLQPQTITSTPTSQQPETTWTSAVFAAIEWRRFEAVCESLFGQAGFETKSQSHGADGGVDIWLHSRNATGPVAVVQCKHWQGKAVGVKEMREFYGVMSAHQLKRGTYATTSTYTTDATQFAKDNGINTLDGKALLALIAKRTPEQQQALLAVAFEGEYWRPTCASCGIKMVERTPAKGGANFWGCTNYPLQVQVAHGGGVALRFTIIFIATCVYSTRARGRFRINEPATVKPHSMRSAGFKLW